MTDSDQESTSNTDDLISGIYRLEDISPLTSPSPPTADPAFTPDTKSTPAQKIMSENRDSGQGSSTVTLADTCFDKSNFNTVKAKCDSPRSLGSPRSRSLSPQSRIRVHYTDSAREALDLANKSYERLVEESDERHQLSILINKRDLERVELQKADVERAERRKLELEQAANDKENRILKAVHKPTLPGGGDKFAQPITVIQEHIRFAESILASPASSESERRSRSVSPLSPPHRLTSPTQHSHRLGNRSRSSSPQIRYKFEVPSREVGGGSPFYKSPFYKDRSSYCALSSRKKLNFEGEQRSRSPLLSRSGREKTAQEIKTRVTNDYIEATSLAFKHHSPGGRTMSDRMAAVSNDRTHADSKSAAKPVPADTRGQEFTDIYITPEKSRQVTSVRRSGPMSSTPHRQIHREPLRDLSPNRLYSNEQPSRANGEVTTTASTPSAYIKGLQSVRSGLRKLMSDDVDTAEGLMVEATSRVDNVSLRIESTINAENQLLRDQLTRERNLRKQIEADKHELQSQLLESKDRLHHLTATLKQKDSIMKKLDQNLEDVVRGWQNHEQENKQRTESLSHNIRRLERELEEQKTHTAGLENDLTSAVEDLKQEKNTSRDLTREASEQQSRYQEGLTDLKNLLEREREKSLRLELERAQTNEGRVHLEKQLEGLTETLDQERDIFKEREQELLNKINEITSVQIAVLEQEAARTKAQADKIEGLDMRARKFEQEAESLRHLVSSKTKEVERLQSLLELTDAKHQNSLRQLESKLRIELELRVSQAKDDGLKRLADSEINLQQAHQRQLADIVSEHNRQLGAMRERYNNELNRVKNHFGDQVKTAESSLEETKQELEAAVSQKEIAESQRDDLTSRLQAVLTLLGTTVGGGAIPTITSASSHCPPSGGSHSRPDDVSFHQPPRTYSFAPTKPLSVDVSPGTPERPPTPQMSANSTPFGPYAGDTNAAKYSDTSGTSGEDKGTSQTSNDPAQGDPDCKPSAEKQHYSGDYQQQYEQHRQSYKEESEKPEVEKEHDTSSVISTTETYDLNENDSAYRHKRQAELQDYIKKLLNRSVGDPLIETRIDLDESHISVISGLQEHSVILHDGSHEHHSPKKAFRHDIIGHTPPVKGSSKKVNPEEIASLITKYGSESTTPSTTEYIEYLKSVAFNNHAGFLREFDSKAKASSNKNAAKRDLTDTFNTSSSSHRPTSHKRSTSTTRVKSSSPEKSTISRQAKEKDKTTKVKRHSSMRTQAIWK